MKLYNMKKIIPVILSILVFISFSCSGRRAVSPDIVEGYFAVFKPGKPSYLVIKDKAGFDAEFHPAQTMTNNTRSIDFTKSFVVGIVLPESQNDMKINLDGAYIDNKVLHIRYNIYEGEKRSFSIIPQIVFAFDSSLIIDSISYDNSNGSSEAMLF